MSTLAELLTPINKNVAPLVRAGFGNPLMFTAGATVLEVPGRKTGQTRSVPLACYLVGGVMIIGTVRSNSQWMKNLDAAEEPHVWLWGRRHRANKLLVTDHAAWLALSA